MSRERENLSEQREVGVSQSEQNCDLSINKPGTVLESETVHVLIPMVQLVCLYLACRVRY